MSMTPGNALITGGNSGIGRAIAHGVAARGYRVLIASRDAERSRRAVAAIKAEVPGADISGVILDLGDFDSVDRCALEVRERMPVIDVLMLNAGLYTYRLRKVPSGFEAMIGVMHFGHFRLTRNLLDRVRAAGQGRIVVTCSTSHHPGRIDETSFTEPSRHWLPFSAYAQAKLANLLFTRELARRLADTSVTANAFHPGGVATGIWAELPGPVRRLIRPFLIGPEQGADTALWLATAPEGGRYSGEYFVRRKRKPGSRASRDDFLAAKLWAISERWMGGQ